MVSSICSVANFSKITSEIQSCWSYFLIIKIMVKILKIKTKYFNQKHNYFERKRNRKNKTLLCISVLSLIKGKHF